MYYLFKTSMGDEDHYTVTSKTERTLWCETAAEAYEDWVLHDVKTFSEFKLNHCLENFTLVASSEDITTLFHSCPELLL
jgi:hypothetical protein